MVRSLLLIAISLVPSLALAQSGPPEECGMQEAQARYGLEVGTQVTLQRHRFVGIDENWDPKMARYLGRAARVTALAGVDARGCPGVRVDVDGGHWFWRVRDLGIGTAPHAPPGAAVERQSGAEACGQREDRPEYGALSVGSVVTLGRHRPVGGEDNWADEMEPFVGRRARVTELAGLDSRGCAGLRVDVDGGQWFWRARDVRLSGSSEPIARPVGVTGIAADHGRNEVVVQDPNDELFGPRALDVPEQCGLSDAQVSWGPIRVGADVVLGQHRDVNGDRNWSPEMQALVGSRTRVSELIGVDDQGCPVVRVEADRGQYFWRVRDMTLP
jgi:hypothetical protein